MNDQHQRKAGERPVDIPSPLRWGSGTAGLGGRRLAITVDI